MWSLLRNRYTVWNISDQTSDGSYVRHHWRRLRIGQAEGRVCWIPRQICRLWKKFRMQSNYSFGLHLHEIRWNPIMASLILTCLSFQQEKMRLLIISTFNFSIKLQINLEQKIVRWVEMDPETALASLPKWMRYWFDSFSSDILKLGLKYWNESTDVCGICTWDSVCDHSPNKTHRKHILLKNAKISKSNIKYKINHALHSLKCLKIINQIETFVFESNASGQKKKNLIERISFVFDSFCLYLVSRENGQTFQNRRPKVRQNYWIVER